MKTTRKHHKRLSLLLMALSFATLAIAAPVDSDKAMSVARQYLSIVEPTVNGQLSLCHTWSDSQGNPLLYVFNIGQTGFIIVSADDDLTPIAGYSLNGAYDHSQLSDNLRNWIQSCATDIEAFLAPHKSLTAETIREQQRWKEEWEALASKDNGFYSSKSTKSVNALLSTTWSQGGGYNNYCPEYPSGDNGHSVTGCVATAMAQIIRYHQYPNTGFWHNQYVHSYFGVQRADFDSAYYDFTKMPNYVNSYSPSAQQHAVSLLCYHCGVSVNMNYENPNHTSGSGAHSEDVPDALKYFGYTNSYYLNKNGIESSVWDSLLRHDLDLGRPVYYSGSSSQGGHAFVCDGYNNSNKYHFNFGWGGYGDGFYSLTYVNGYSTGQGAVFNIVPSKLAANIDTIYIDSASNGDGSSWGNANPNLEAALVLRGMYKKGVVYVKQGTYYGNTNADNAFLITQGLKIYGSFDSTGTIQDALEHPSVMSGQGLRRTAYSPAAFTKATNIYKMTFADGYADNGAALVTKEGLTLEGCVFENSRCSQSDGSAVQVSSGSLNCCYIRNNKCNGVSINDGHVKNNLIVHNDGFGAAIRNGDLTNCSVVSNTGTGVVNNGGTIRGCAIWNNGNSLSDSNTSNMTFCAVEGFGEIDSNSNFGLNPVNDPPTGDGPIFLNPDTTRGPSSVMGDWHLSSRSPLVDAADTVRSGNFIRDLDGNNRFMNRRSDIGCYESDPAVAIVTPQTADILLYPNPATNSITLVGVDGEIVVFNIMGQRIMTIKANNSGLPVTIDISQLNPGVYVIKASQVTAHTSLVTGHSSQITKRFIKQ